MANTVGRVLKYDILTTWAPLEALGSGIDQLFMVSNINHLGDESNYRTLCSVPGFGVGGVQILRNSPTGAGVGTPPTTPSDFDWFSPRQYFPSVVPYSAVTCLGTHVVHRLARNESVWPDLVLRCRVDTPTTLADKLFACLLIQPGSSIGPISAPTAMVGGSFKIESISGGVGWADFIIRYRLSDRDVYPSVVSPLLGAGATTGVPLVGETVIASQINVWLSFFTTETGGKACQAVGITLALEPQP